MSTIERTPDPTGPATVRHDPVRPQDELDTARRAAQELARAGRDAIRRALSGDSRAFLRAAVQRGGQ